MSKKQRDYALSFVGSLTPDFSKTISFSQIGIDQR